MIAAVHLFCYREEETAAPISEWNVFEFLLPATIFWNNGPHLISTCAIFNALTQQICALRRLFFKVFYYCRPATKMEASFANFITPRSRS